MMMEAKLYVGNLPRSTTGKELTILFAQAGDVTAIDIIPDRLTGGCRGYAYVTMSALSEADKAVSMFNAYFLEDQPLKVILVKGKDQRGFTTRY
jgi:RNA recognition motif-containing protein